MFLPSDTITPMIHTIHASSERRLCRHKKSQHQKTHSDSNMRMKIVTFFCDYIWAHEGAAPSYRSSGVFGSHLSLNAHKLAKANNENKELS